MKKILNFDKEINFPTMIGEITSIALDHSLKFTSSSDIEGSFFIKGTYKMTEASHLEEEFDYNIPVDITLTENLDFPTCKVEIEDFYYEIINDDTLKCSIDVLVEGLEEIILDEKEEILEVLETPVETKKVEVEEIETLTRECDDDIIPEEEKEIPIREEDLSKGIQIEKDILQSIEYEKPREEMPEEELLPKDEKKTENIETIFSAFKDTEETFKSYSVYILRKNDTLEKIYSLYNVTQEELCNYNNLDDISIGMKIIIPNQKEMAME